MDKKICLLLLSALLASMFVSPASAQAVEADETIYIMADGTISPPTAPITTIDNITYVFTGDISDPVVIGRNNIVVDGMDHLIENTDFEERGIVLMYRNNVTLKNINIKVSADAGIFLYHSSNVKISQTIVTAASEVGIWLISSSNNTLTGNTITNAKSGWVKGCGIKLSPSSDCNFLSRNNVTNSRCGIHMDCSSNNTLSNNAVAANEDRGIWAYNSSYNAMTGNEATDSYYGIHLDCSSGNTLSSNSLKRNVFGALLVSSARNSLFDNNVTSNDNGIYLDSSPNNTLTGNSVADNRDGVMLTSSSYNILSDNNITADKYYGFRLASSSSNILHGNNVINNYYGIYCLSSSNNNTLYGNNLTNNHYGIAFDSSSSNTLSGSTVAECTHYGIWLGSSFNNNIFHNNFVGNSPQVFNYLGARSATWDNGFEGNYWSDYNGTDFDHDGIGDTQYEIDTLNSDHRPLMGLIVSFNSLGKDVTVISNSTIHAFCYSESNRTILMEVSNMTSDQEFGFIRICIPHALMRDYYQVFIDGADPYYVNYALFDNGTHRWIYFSYQHSDREVVIASEYSSLVIPQLLIMATLLTIVTRRRNESSRDHKSSWVSHRDQNQICGFKNCT